MFNLNFKLIRILFLILALVSQLLITPQAFCQSNSQVLKLEAVSYITWWFHDATGYHPAILLRLENASGVDLSGVLIKFQARFTNLRTAYINVARQDKRTNFTPGKRMVILLRAPKAYELPIDQHLWPKIECKVMCRVGEVGDEQTQNLIITKLDSLTMSYDEAMTMLSKRNDIRLKKAPRITRGGLRNLRKEKALVASAGSLGKSGSSVKKVTLQKYLSTNTLPGLGNDFYRFEKKFGLPITTDTSNTRWTWASYSVESLDLDIIVGSRGKTGKADLIVVRLPSYSVKNDNEVMNLTKALGGIHKSESLSRPVRAVRYLPSGRIEFGLSQAQNYRSAFFPPRTKQDTTYEVVVTSLPGNVLNILRNEVRSAKLLKFLQPVTGLADSQ